MQLNTLDDPTLQPVVCTDGEPPYYCPASMEQLRITRRIRYLVTTRGVPTRMTVDGSTLSAPNAPTSVDNYLKYWLINYFTEDVKLAFNEREAAFGDGRGMRTVEPATDLELIVGRIDGLNLAAAKALVDRALAVEGAGHLRHLVRVHQVFPLAGCDHGGDDLSAVGKFPAGLALCAGPVGRGPPRVRRLSQLFRCAARGQGTGALPGAAQ